MASRSLKEKTLLFSLLFFAIVALIALFMVLFGSRSAFNTETQVRLEQLSEKKALEFESDLNAQIALVLQMTKSPVFRRFIENPKDKELYESAKAEVRAYQDSFLAQSSFWISDYDKQFYSNLEKSYIVDPADPAQYWYKMTMDSSEDYNFNINYNPDLKVTNLWINAVVRDDKGKNIGIAGTGIPLDGFFDKVYSNLSKDTTMYMYNSALEVTGTTDKAVLEAKTSVTELLKELKNHEIFGKNKEKVILTSRGVYVIADIKTVGWDLVLFTPFTFKDIFNKSLLTSSLTLVLTVLLIILVFDIFIFTILRSMKSVISATKESATEQADFMNGVKDIVAENVGSIDSLGTLMQLQNTTINQSQEHISTLSNMISSVDGIRRDSLANTKELALSSDEGAKQLKALEERIAAFEKCTAELVKTNNLISGITAKTNLLAINAGIEASHAGEYGKSFAVVAKEIRELAERSRGQESDVASSIEEMLNMMKEMSASSVTVKESFDKIVECSKRVIKNFEEMSHSIEEQNIMGQTVDANLREIMENVRQTGESFAKMRNENEALSSNITTASAKAEKILEACDKVILSTGL